MVPGSDHDPDETKLPAGTPGSGGAHDAGAPGTVAPGTFVGPYKLLRYIDEGAMGEVWLAERRDTFRQKVALKLLTASGIRPREAIARFDQEREVLASMSHDHVARIFDGGVHGGRPWFAMEFVDGEPITDFCDRRGLGVRERLALFRQVCDAVTHAHRRGIIHRDIKPSNILVGMGTGSVPQAKVIDFGIAKAMAQRLTDHTSITVEHRPIGTYEYMSPEQADPGGRDIDTRTDVYSLGVVLYELLSGVKPFDLEKRAVEEKLRIIREEDAPTPSVRLSTASARDSGTAERISKARREEIQHLIRNLRSELEWIPLMAIRKDRERRYRDVDELSEDVQNYLDGKALVAAPESRLYVFRKFAQRNRNAIRIAAVLVFALMVVVLAVPGVARLARSQNTVVREFHGAWQQAREDADRRARVIDFQRRMLASVIALHGSSDAAKESIDRVVIAPAVNSLDRYSEGDLLTTASLQHALADMCSSVDRLESALVLQESALSTRRGLLPADHPDVFQSVDAMASLLSKSKRYAEAEALSREALDMCKRVVRDEPRIIRCLIRHGGILAALDRVEEAERALTDAGLGSLQQFGEADSRTVWIIRILVDFYAAREVRDPGQGYAAKAAEWRAKLPAAGATAQPPGRN